MKYEDPIHLIYPTKLIKEKTIKTIGTINNLCSIILTKLAPYKRKPHNDNKKNVFPISINPALLSSNLIFFFALFGLLLWLLLIYYIYKE